jgi:queuine tRNA-ribosyltransferase
MSKRSLSTRIPFHVLATDSTSGARLGVLETMHGPVETPVFMPVGTRGVVRTQTSAQLQALDPAIILSNTYHLFTRPGFEFLRERGGLHSWIRWPKALLTDSGGFQVFSLASARTLDESGISFRPQPNAAAIVLTPELAVAMQTAIGSDIMMVLDECVAATSSFAVAKAAMERTHRWALRSHEARPDNQQALFAIVQGACFPELRRASVQTLTDCPGFDGFAIGGLAVGESKSQREDMTELCTMLLPQERPRYLMGVGMPIDLLEGVRRGIDMFDCILPTSLAQQGVAFTSGGKVLLRRSAYQKEERSLDPECSCEACTHYSLSLLHHLLKCQEPVIWPLLAQHNLRFYLGLMQKIRGALAKSAFGAFYQRMRESLVRTDERITKGAAPRAASPPTRGAFALRQAAAGHYSVVHLESGEVMHSVHAPDDEAHRLYVAQSLRVAKALRGELGRELIVWDVGLGAGHNAMAMLRAFEASAQADPLRLISFEIDTDAFALALAHHGRFSHLHHRAPSELLANAATRGEKWQWSLVHGDFSQTMASALAADVVLFDPFSTRVDVPLWQRPFLSRVYAAMQRGGELFTYSDSTAVRARMLGAGFWVARGDFSGPKRHSTIAHKMDSHAEIPVRDWLDSAWLGKWQRSSVGGAASDPSFVDPEMQALLENHPQFR